MTPPSLPRLVCGPIVRSTGMTWSSIWVEVDRASAFVVRCRQHHPAPRRGARAATVESDVGWTVEVRGRHYALLRIDGLRPGTLYTYQLLAVTVAGGKRPKDRRQFRARKPEPLDLARCSYGLGPTLRTFARPHAEELRIAFGSCRCFEGGFHGGYGEDVFEAYATHLGTIAAERVTQWPTMLLLLGDQIYGDDVAQSVIARLRAKGRVPPRLTTLRGTYEHLQEVLDYERATGRYANTIAGSGKFHLGQFDDYATLYEASWTAGDVPKLLASVPTFMACDDHEVTDKWNITGGWVDNAEDDLAWHDVVVEAMMAFWIYQAWGNHAWPADDPRMAALDAARRAGEDAHDRLFAVFERWFAGDRLVNYFRIASTPPVIVLDTRSDRKHVAPIHEHGVTRYADVQDRILSDAQLAWFTEQLAASGPIVVASSVPLYQTKAIDIAQFLGVRPFLDFGRAFETASQANAKMCEYYRREYDLETISAFPASWLDLLLAISKVDRVIWLAGDIHFSGIHHGDLTTAHGTCRLTHVVSSGFRHLMERKEFKAVAKLADPMQAIEDAYKRIDPAVATLLEAGPIGVVLTGGPIAEAIATASWATPLVPPRNTTLVLGVGESSVQAAVGFPVEDVEEGMTRANTVGMVSFGRTRGSRAQVALGAPIEGVGFEWRRSPFE